MVDIFPSVLLVGYLYILLSTQILSLFKLISTTAILASDGLFLLTIALFLKNRLKAKLRVKFKKGYLLLVILGSLTFIQGFFSAPNTTDSMVYHITRVMYWIQNKTVFQTSIFTSHDYMPPFAEYILLHLYLIFGSDRMLFISQWGAYVFSIVLSDRITVIFRSSEKTRLYLLVLVATLPMAVLQATSTQTDLVTSVLFLLSLYFALMFWQRGTIKNILMFSIASALALLTKPSVVAFLIIPIAYVLSGMWFNKTDRFKRLFLGMLIAGAIILPFLGQNIKLYNAPLGRPMMGQEKLVFTNQSINLGNIFYNSVRNLFLHIPLPLVGSYIESSLKSAFVFLGINIDDPRTSLMSTGFHIEPMLFPQEDLVGNPLQLFLFLASGYILFLRKPRNKILVASYLLSVLSFILFSGLLKWQLWNSRLHLPLFFIATILATVILQRHEKFLKTISVLSFVLAVAVILLNTSRPYIPYKIFYNQVKQFSVGPTAVPESFFLKPRVEQYFNARPYWYEPYREASVVIMSHPNIHTVKISLIDGYEYPLWLMLKQGHVNIEPIQNNLSLEGDSEMLLLTTKNVPQIIQDSKSQCFKANTEYGDICLYWKEIK